MSNNLLLSGPYLPLLVVLIAYCYLLGAFVLYRIGRKFGIGSFGAFCIPVYNCVLLCRCAEISPVLLLLLLIPVVNLGVIVYLWGTIAKKMGHQFWIFGLGTLLVGIPSFILAFDGSKPVRNDTTKTLEPYIYCISGEFSGNRLPVGRAGLIIGRSAEKSNLVLSSPEVSAVHARVWSDPESRVWVEDISSSNGTYYCSQPGPGEPPQWMQVNEPMALARGAHFRLGDNAVEFEVS